MSKSPTPFDDLDGTGNGVPLSKNTQPLPSRPGSLLSNLQTGRTLPPDPDLVALPTAPNPLPINPPTSAAPAPVQAPATVPSSNPTGKLKWVPLPTLIGLAMAAGALGVVLIPALMRRVIPTVPIKTLPDTTVSAPDGAVPMLPPSDSADAVPSAPDDSSTLQTPPRDAAASTPLQTWDQSEATPRVEPTAAPSPPAVEPAPRTDTSEATATAKYRASRYEIAPPVGWKKVRSGRRTEWKGPDEAQLLVETTGQANNSPREDWEKLERGLARKYGRRFRSLGIRESTLDGKSAAIWEFEIEGKDGRVTRKIDVAVHHKGRGYAVLGAAPAENFESLRPQIESAINSFRLNDNVSSTEDRSPSSRESKRESAIPIPENDSPARDDELPEQGY